MLVQQLADVFLTAEKRSTVCRWVSQQGLEDRYERALKIGQDGVQSASGDGGQGSVGVRNSALDHRDQAEQHVVILCSTCMESKCVDYPNDTATGTSVSGIHSGTRRDRGRR